MPDQPGDAGDADQEHDGSGGEQETQEPHQQRIMKFRFDLAPQ